MNSRERVYRTLEMRNPDRPPREMWLLPWAQSRYGKEIEEIQKRFPVDFAGTPDPLKEYPKVIGNSYEIGTYIDEWGCQFTNIHSGVVGEIKNPIIKNDDWSDADSVRFPVEWKTVDIDKVNRFCASSDRFVVSGCCPRPFEQMQFMRGSEQFFLDIMEQPPKMMSFMNKIHEFYCELLHIWAKTDVDTLNIMDDWGTQTALLINPKLWRQIFKPMYRDYINIARGAGKKMFMHSDGYTLEIYPDLIELGLDAFNSQIFCMGVENLKQFAGKITFWGEIDRQYLLANASLEEVEAAVRSVKENLWHNGGCIAQMEFGPGGRPENVMKAYETWDELF